jgi:uncharacterized GH25 family protein
MTPRAAALAFAASAVAAAAAFAHDFWLAPSSFRPKAGDEVSVRLLVGEDLTGESRKREEARIESFEARGPGDVAIPVGGRTGDDPAGRVKLPADGTWVVGFRSKPTAITVDARKFEDYLRHEGLDRIAQERERLGERERTGQELYARCAKAILCVGTGDPGEAGRRLGLRLEIVPETNPYRAAAGDEITFRTWFDDRPVEGLLVRGVPDASRKDAVEARTDAEGRVKLRLAHPGPWFVGGVHMIRSDAKRTYADWESFWASVTFDLAERPKPGAPR